MKVAVFLLLVLVIFQIAGNISVVLWPRTRHKMERIIKGHTKISLLP